MERLQTSKSLPVDGADGGERGEAHGGEDGRLEEVEVVANRVERRSNDTSQTGGIGGVDASGDLLDTVQGEVTREAVVNLDGTSDGLAAGKGVGIGLGHDSGVTAYASQFLPEESTTGCLLTLAGEGELGRCQRGQEVLDEGHDDESSGVTR